MDSSDTDDHFESADEDFSSDEGQVKSKHSKSSLNTKSQTHITSPETIKSVQVSDTNTSKLKISSNNISENTEQLETDVENNTLILKSTNDNKCTLETDRSSNEQTNINSDQTSDIHNNKHTRDELNINQSDSCIMKSISKLTHEINLADDKKLKTKSKQLENIRSNLKQNENVCDTETIKSVNDSAFTEHDTTKEKCNDLADNNAHFLKLNSNENISKVSEDIWGEGDGWGWNEDTKMEQTNDDGQDENMWGDNEGWDVKDPTIDTKKENVPSNKETSKSIVKKKVKEIANDNLWDDSDDWEASINAETVRKSKELPKDDNLWNNEDNWGVHNDKIKTDALNKISEPDSTWGSWGNWGISSVLSTAANITTTVSHGLTTVLETGIGVPNPEELARQHKAEKESTPPQIEELDKRAAFGLGNFVSSVSTITKLVESTSTKVISGGLDTLETIGKKTMEVLQENDPGLKKKRAFLKIDQDKPVLSQILREAKSKAEEENKECIKRHVLKKANYETVFDDYQGLVHLEALEMLSKQCDIKLDSLLAKCKDGDDLQETMDQVKELCEIPEEDEDEILLNSEVAEKIETAVADINIGICYNKFLSTWEETEKWIGDLDPNVTNSFEIHQHAIESLAQLTAFSVEQFHKAGELLLIKEHRSTADEADSLVQLTSLISSLINKTAAKLAEKLSGSNITTQNKDELNNIITTIFFEAANSSRYVEDAFQLLIPVLQVGAI